MRVRYVVVGSVLMRRKSRIETDNFLNSMFLFFTVVASQAVYQTTNGPFSPITIVLLMLKKLFLAASML